MDGDSRQLATSFGRVAEAYERSRPLYAEAAVRWLAGDQPADVLDLGAGTGKLTRQLVALGHHVVAVDPLAEMLAQLRVAVPGVETRAGTGERIPLQDSAVDVVTVAQAFHWFDRPAALREIARVLRPGGSVALVWNVRDEAEAWVAELSDAMGGWTRVGRHTEPIDASGLYGPVEQATFRHAENVSRHGLRELVLSRSYCAVMSDGERAPVFERADRLFDEHASGGVVRLSYLTECFRAVRL